MKDIKKERFTVWLMFLIPIAFTGWWSVIVWTMVQIALCNNQCEKRNERKVSLKEKPEIIEMNKEENLTEEDKLFMKETGATIKLKEGVYGYDR